MAFNQMTNVAYLPDEISFTEGDVFEEDLIDYITRPMSPYAVQRINRQWAAGYGCILWHPATSARFEMLEEWWLENEPDLSPDARGRCARRRLRRG